MDTSTDPDHLIYKWGDANNPAAFGGISSVKHNSPTLSPAQIKDQLVEIPTYQKYRIAKRPRQVNPYFVRKLRKIFQSDIVFMRNPISMVQENRGYQYILIVQDIFSRKIWATPLKNKSSAKVFPALRNIFNELAPFHKDARLVIDRGTEYLNNAVLEMLAALGVQVTHPSDGHASHVERANLSLQRILYQYMDHTEGGTSKWIDFLSNAVKIMNSRRHRIIRMSPNDAELPENVDKVNNAMSLYRHKAFRKEQLKNHLKKPAKYEVGDLVRVQRYPNVFARGYDRTYSKEIFKIIKVLNHLPITMFTLSDVNDKEIDGNFYPEELSVVKGNLFKVEKIIKRRTLNGVRQLFVKWEGYPDNFNSWIREDSYKRR